MIVSLPLVVLFAAGVFLIWKFMGLKIWHALICVILGFLLASTSVAPQINSAFASVAHWLSSGHSG